jgi:hypothetical protein
MYKRLNTSRNIWRARDTPGRHPQYDRHLGTSLPLSIDSDTDVSNITLSLPDSQALNSASVPCVADRQATSKHLCFNLSDESLRLVVRTRPLIQIQRCSSMFRSKEWRAEPIGRPRRCPCTRPSPRSRWQDRPYRSGGRDGV